MEAEFLKLFVLKIKTGLKEVIFRGTCYCLQSKSKKIEPQMGQNHKQTFRLWILSIRNFVRSGILSSKVFAESLPQTPVYVRLSHLTCLRCTGFSLDIFLELFKQKHFSFSFKSLPP